MKATKFKSGDFVEKIQPNKDGTREIEMIDCCTKDFFFPVFSDHPFPNIEMVLGFEYYRPISSKEILIRDKQTKLSFRLKIQEASWFDEIRKHYIEGIKKGLSLNQQKEQPPKQ